MSALFFGRLFLFGFFVCLLCLFVALSFGFLPFLTGIPIAICKDKGWLMLILPTV